MTSPPSRLPRLPDEGEVRELVARVVDAVMAADASGPEPAASDVGPATEVGTAPDSGTAPSPSSPDHPTIAIGADHGGYPLKERLAFRLKEAGYEVTDVGTHSHESVDYPDFAHGVARLVAEGTCTYGIVVDGAGIGSAMVANKVPGVRAALCYDLSTARNSREHNHANVLTLGAGLTGDGLAWQIVQEWLAVPWGPGRHARRVDKITEVEQQYAR